MSATTTRLALERGLQALGLRLSQAQVEQLLAYSGLLQKWNGVYNLTALRRPEDMLTHHLLDSLAAVPPLLRHLGGKGWDEDGDRAEAACRLLDVGSGGGLPGVVIAVCCPDVVVDCIDTVGKKAAFIQQAAGALKLPNLRGVHGRVEQQGTKAAPYDVVTSRAFASLPDFVGWSRASLAKGGVWMAMKGKFPAEEQAELPGWVDVFHVEQLTVPGLDADRCIVWMRERVSEPGPM